MLNLFRQPQPPVQNRYKSRIVALPDMTAPYKTSGKLEDRAWFSPEEYKMLYEATRERAKNPPKPRWREVCETFHDYPLFMGTQEFGPMSPRGCSGVKIGALAWPHNSRDLAGAVGDPMPRYYEVGNEPILAIFDCGDHFKICLNMAYI